MEKSKIDPFLDVPELAFPDDAAVCTWLTEGGVLYTIGETGVTAYGTFLPVESSIVVSGETVTIPVGSGLVTTSDGGFLVIPVEQVEPVQ